MTEYAASRPAPISRLRDMIDLGKPRLSVLVIFTSATGVWLAPSPPGPARTLAFLLATSCLVASANVLNAWIERDTDARMHRTRNRPLPAGRLDPPVALVYGIVLAALSLAGVALSSNALTTLLGAIAFVFYVLIYTPMKRWTPWAVVVGAVPGAIPPLMGWTAATGSLGAPGWFLFGILFFWQLPHFIAIALHLEQDYRRGGIQALPVARGPLSARRILFLTTVLLVAFTLAAPAFGVGGAASVLAAALLGAGFLVWAAAGLRRDASSAWARRLFAFTLIYLPILVTVVVLDNLG